MSSPRWNVALVAAAAVAVWLQYLGGPPPVHVVVVAVLVVVVGAAVTWRFAVTGLRRRVPVGLPAGAAAAAVVAGLSGRAGVEGGAALVAVVLALSSVALLRPAPVPARVRLATVLREAADEVATASATEPVAPEGAGVGTEGPGPLDAALSLRVLHEMSHDLPAHDLPTHDLPVRELPEGERRVHRDAVRPVARERRAVH